MPEFSQRTAIVFKIREEKPNRAISILMATERNEAQFSNMDQAPTCALGPRALLSGLGVASAWNIPGPPLTPQDRYQLLKQLRAHRPELSPPCLPARTQAEMRTPLLLSDRACFCQSRFPSHHSEQYSPHLHLSLSSWGAIIFHPARNKQTRASHAR